jgi:hypothetical protein
MAGAVLVREVANWLLPEFTNWVNRLILIASENLLAQFSIRAGS